MCGLHVSHVSSQINTQDWGACRDILSKLEAQVGRLEALMEQEQVPAGVSSFVACVCVCVRRLASHVLVHRANPC